MAKGRQVYDADTKQKFLAAVQAARNAGLNFEEQHKAAVEAGYKGKAPSLYVMVSKLGMTKKGKPGRPTKAKAVEANVLPAKRRGRPPGIKSPVAKLGSGLQSIDAIIRDEVSSRLNAAIEAAVKALQSARL